MGEKRQLGLILLESGRITQQDVERALAHQREHGGFFGQALVALGTLSQEEIDWALASHFELPFIFPKAEAVDPEAAHMVPADWALAHMAVPIVKAGRTLTVVVAEPLRREDSDELSARTGCELEMALASAGRIRELIHAVYGAAQAQRTDDEPLAVTELIAHALEQGAERFGISIRGTTAVGWWRARREMHRAPLSEGWEAALEEAFEPAPLERLHAIENGRAEWQAALHRGGAELPLDAQALVGAGGSELLFRPRGSVGAPQVPANVILPPTLITELRLLWRGGSARVGVTAAHLESARALLPLLPALALGQHVRAAHVNATGEAGGVYTLRAEPTDQFAGTVAACELDALTVDLPVDGYPVRALLQAAPLCFMLLDEPEERAGPGEWGINWLLMIGGRPGSYAWDLRALHR